MDGLIYVLGGENEDTEVLLTMEVFDPHLNNWTTQTSMTTVRKVSQSNAPVFIVIQLCVGQCDTNVSSSSLVWLLCYHEEEALRHGRRVLREDL